MTPKTKGLALIFVALGAFVALGVASHKGSAKVDLDPNTLCPIGRAETTRIWVLLDRTDVYSASQIESLRQKVIRLRSELPPAGRLSIALITADPKDAGSPVFDMCSPGDGRSVDPLTGNVRRAQKRFDAQFGAPLDQIMAMLAEPQSFPKSPIIESITQASLAAACNGAQADCRLLVISDAMQNSHQISHYRRLPSVEEVVRSTTGRLLLASGLGGWTVEISYQRNAGALLHQGPRHLQHWIELLSRAGATVKVTGSAANWVASQ